MPHSAAVPFVIRRSNDVVGALEITSTTETVHGLLRLEGDRLQIQWRVARSTDRVGMQIRTDKQVEPVREVSVPLTAVAGAAVRWRWWWPPGHYLVLTAADLRAFEGVVGAAGLALDHPAELALRLRGSDRALGSEFAMELELALAERELANVEAAQLEESRAGELPAAAIDHTAVRVHREPDIHKA
jgi:hypothetical protein